jgi:hypothetical protein
MIMDEEGMLVDLSISVIGSFSADPSPNVGPFRYGVPGLLTPDPLVAVAPLQNVGPPHCGVLHQNNFLDLHSLQT